MSQHNTTSRSAGDPGPVMDTIDKMRVVAAWLDEKQALDVVALDVAGICSIAEGLVIASAKSARHAQALADFLLESVKKNGLEFMGMEGHKGGTWILVDLNDVLVHLFRPETREFYNLEGLWSEAGRLELNLETSGRDGRE